MKKPLVWLIVWLMMPGMVGTAEASQILQPVAAWTDMGASVVISPWDGESITCSSSHVIDQSSLSSHYISMVDDFETYIASSPTSFHNFGKAMWGSAAGVRSGYFDLALGGSFVINSLAIWNLEGDSSSIREFNLILSDDSSFNNSRNLGMFTASNSLGADQLTEAQIFTFSPATASFVRLEILNTWSSDSYNAGFNEVAFGATPIPVPAAIWLLGSGLAGLIGIKKKKRIKS